MTPTHTWLPAALASLGKAQGAVLATLAFSADSTGLVRVSQATVAASTHLSAGAVKDALKALRSKGILVAQATEPGSVPAYQLAPPPVGETPPPGMVATPLPPGMPSTPPPVCHDTPPSPHLEPAVHAGGYSHAHARGLQNQNLNQDQNQNQDQHQVQNQNQEQKNTKTAQQAAPSVVSKSLAPQAQATPAKHTQPATVEAPAGQPAAAKDFRPDAAQANTVAATQEVPPSALVDQEVHGEVMPPLELLPPVGGEPESIQELFKTWQAAVDQPGSKLLPKRRAVLVTLLKDHGLDRAKSLLRGLGLSQWHRENGHTDPSVAAKPTNEARFLELDAEHRAANAPPDPAKEIIPDRRFYAEWEELRNKHWHIHPLRYVDPAVPCDKSKFDPALVPLGANMREGRKVYAFDDIIMASVACDAVAALHIQEVMLARYPGNAYVAERLEDQVRYARNLQRETYANALRVIADKQQRAIEEDEGVDVSDQFPFAEVPNA